MCSCRFFSSSYHDADLESSSKVLWLVSARRVCIIDGGMQIQAIGLYLTPTVPCQNYIRIIARYHDWLRLRLFCFEIFSNHISGTLYYYRPTNDLLDIVIYHTKAIFI